VCAFELVWQIDGQGDRRDGVLKVARFVPDLDWIAQVRHANAVNRNPAKVGFILSVFELDRSKCHRVETG
jgi:hypothetical protein